MLNYYFMTMGPGSSPDPNIYYRTVIDKKILSCYTDNAVIGNIVISQEVFYVYIG